MKTSSAKAKGRRLQQTVRDLLLKFAAQLTPDDVRSTSMGAPGEDLLLSPAAQAAYPFTFECKNVEKLNIHEALSQSESHAMRNGRAAVVVFSRNRSKIYIALEFEEFLKLTRK